MKNLWSNRRAATVTTVSTLILAFHTSVPAKPKKINVAKQFRGQIVFQSDAFEAYADEKAFLAAIKKAKETSKLKRLKGSGGWRMHLIAFLKKAPRAPKVNLVWYRLGPKRPEQVDFTEFIMPPKGKTLQAVAELSKAQGFKSGDRLEARITRLIRGQEVVYAKCQVTLE